MVNFDIVCLEKEHETKFISTFTDDYFDSQSESKKHFDEHFETSVCHTNLRNFTSL